MAETFRGLHYLTDDDCRLLKERSERKDFGPGEILIQHGVPTREVYLLVSGKARIDGTKGPIAYIGEGDICGEMAFLEESVPSATVVAEKDVEAYAISWDALRKLFDMFPHFGSRFHRSVAMNLSQRLRNQIAPKKTVSKS